MKCSKNQQVIKIEGFKPELIAPYQKVLISDTAGMGKSTLMKYLTIKIIEQNIGIPVLIDLRNLSEKNSIINEIKNQLNPIFPILDDDAIFDLIDTGVVIFLLDGFDEIQQKYRELIIKDIRQFIDKAHTCWYILTSRPEPSLTAFGDFQQFNINPLKKEEAFELIQKYDKIKNLGVAPQLIKDIQAKLTQIQSFLTNPFLVSLLYKTYTYTQDIPASKITFYDEVYSALFKHHDLSKGGWQRPKKSKLEIQQFRIVLRQLAFDTLKVNLVSYSKQDALQHIKSAKEKCFGIDFEDHNYLDDLLSAVPIFLDDGLKVKWAHKSFQDFFTAEYLTLDNNKIDKLNQIYKNKKSNYFNVLDLFYELDYKTFRQTIILSLLTDFLNSFDNRHLDFKDVSKELIEQRKILTSFGTSVYLFKKSKDGRASLKAMENEKRESRSGNLGGIHYPNGPSILFEADFRRQLGLMLVEKKEPFIKPEDFYSKFQRYDNLSNEPEKVTDNKELWMNFPENFQKVNDLLRDSHLNPFVFDLKISRDVAERINQEIVQEKMNSSEV